MKKLLFLFTFLFAFLFSNAQKFDTIQSANGLILRWEKIKKIDGRLYMVNFARMELANGDFIEEKRGTLIQPGSIDSLIQASQGPAQAQIDAAEKQLLNEKVKLAVTRREAELVKKTGKELTDAEREKIEKEERQKLKAKTKGELFDVDDIPIEEVPKAEAVPEKPKKQTKKKGG